MVLSQYCVIVSPRQQCVDDGVKDAPDYKGDNTDDEYQQGVLTKCVN